MKIFITGGIGSGKSSFALSIADKLSSERKTKNKIFLATAIPGDDEISEKIKKHRLQRGDDWITIEEPYDIAGHINNQYDVILLDCITMWVTNLFFRYFKEPEKIELIKNSFIRSLLEFQNLIIIVSNETGFGIISDKKEIRHWSNLLSEVNRRIAEISDQVYLIVSGIPIKIKG